MNPKILQGDEEVHRTVKELARWRARRKNQKTSQLFCPIVRCEAVRELAIMIAAFEGCYREADKPAGGLSDLLLFQYLTTC